MATDPLESAKLKIEWAKRHVPDLKKAVVAFFDTQPYRFTVEPEPDGLHETHKVRMSQDIPGDIYMLVGTVVHSLHSSLDYATCRLAEANGATDVEDVSFPFGKTPQIFKDSAKRKIKKLSPPARDFIHALQPYPSGNNWAGNDLLYSLHYLDLRDKHRDLVVVGAQGGLQRINIVYADDMLVHFPGWQSMEDGLHVATVRKHSHYKAEVEAAFSVAFAKIKVFKSQPVVAVMSQLSGMAERIILDIEKNFFSYAHE